MAWVNALLATELETRTMRKIALVCAVMLALGGAFTSASAARSGDFNQWAQPSYQLGGSRTFVLRGEQTGAGCVFSHPAIAGPDDGRAREQRDIAIDTIGCRALVEEGLAPTLEAESLVSGTISATLPAASKFDASAFGGDRKGTSVLDRTRIRPQSAANPDLPTYRHQKLWYEEIFGKSVNSIDTKIKYFWDGHCALGGTTIAPITYLGSSGWNLMSGASNESETCAKYVGNAWATFSNYVFCATEGVTVTVTYSSDKVTGSYTGAVTYSKVNSVSYSCAPLYFHQATGSWTP